MVNQNTVEKNQRKSIIKVRSFLLAAQIILPFVLYYFLQKEWMGGSYLTAGLIAFSMVIILWQK